LIHSVHKQTNRQTVVKTVYMSPAASKVIGIKDKTTYNDLLSFRHLTYPSFLIYGILLD